MKPLTDPRTVRRAKTHVPIHVRVLGLCCIAPPQSRMVLWASQRTISFSVQHARHNDAGGDTMRTRPRMQREATLLLQTEEAPKEEIRSHP